MLKTLIVLAPVDVHEPVASMLRVYNNGVTILGVDSLDGLLAIDTDVLATARLIAFTAPVIVPATVLAALGYGAYNFHPGPPSYPGLAPAHFAIYDRVAVYGATAHLMVEKVDAGPIIAAEFCLVEPGASVGDIELQAFTLLTGMFRRLAPYLSTNPSPHPSLPLAWSNTKSSRRTLRAMCDIPLDITADELARRIRAFDGNHFGEPLIVTLHGYKFRLDGPTSTDMQPDAAQSGEPDVLFVFNSPPSPGTAEVQTGLVPAL